MIKILKINVLKLKELGFKVTDSYANFVFARHPEIDGKELILALRKKGIIVRHWNKERIDQYLRISIGTMEQMKIMLEFLSEYIEKRS